MQRLYSQLIGLSIVVCEESRKLGRVTDLIIDPDRACLVALVTFGKKVIAPIDINPFKGNFWEVKTHDVLINPAELVRLNSISKSRRKLIHKQVVTKSGLALGHVADYVMDMETLSLVQIYVVKGFLFWAAEKRLIEWKSILEITDRAIIVKDHCVSAPAALKRIVPAKTPAN